MFGLALISSAAPSAYCTLKNNQIWQQLKKSLVRLALQASAYFSADSRYVPVLFIVYLLPFSEEFEATSDKVELLRSKLSGKAVGSIKL